jgi:3-methyladenine DNA glycosylase/8-oxoguanine DNA glycosylase
MEIYLSARPPFSLSAVIQSHGWYRLAPFHHHSKSGALGYTHRLHTGRVVLLAIHEGQVGVRVEIPDQIEEDEVSQIAVDVTWMLGLDQDFSEFYMLAAQEPKLAYVPVKAQGRILRSPTLFEDVVKTILTTNTAWGGTIRMNEALIAQFGDLLPGDNAQQAFPTPARLAASDEETLRESTRLGYRSPYILQLAREIDQGSRDLEALKSSALSSEELRQELLSIKGVGNYAAANLLMLLGHYDYLTIDSWALKMVSNEWYDGEPIEPTDVEDAFERWGKWKGLAYWLWDWSFEEG